MTNFVDKVIKDLEALTKFLVGKPPKKVESKPKKIKAKK